MAGAVEDGAVLLSQRNEKPGKADELASGTKRNQVRWELDQDIALSRTDRLALKAKAIRKETQQDPLAVIFYEYLGNCRALGIVLVSIIFYYGCLYRRLW